MAGLLISAYVNEQAKICMGSYISKEDWAAEEDEYYPYYDKALGSYIFILTMVYGITSAIVLVGGTIAGILYCVKGPEFFKKKENEKESLI